MNRNDSEILAETFESVRNLTKFYFSKVKPEEAEIRMVSGDVKFNSPKWIAAHLAWSENFLILQGLGGESSGIEWLEEYGFGSKEDDSKTKLTLEEALSALNLVHEKALKHIKSLTNEQLDEKNLIGANFGGNDSKRSVLNHAIRHEPMHAGQLSWFLKSRGTVLV
ncbi:MAG: DinB family protein [Ignavibacteria bacterium]|nr:DinB family protein [Ignavibacteria bacterium]